MPQQPDWKGPSELKTAITYLWQKIAQVVNHNAIATDTAAFASLPALPLVGMTYVVTDSNTNTWGANIAGGGSNTVLAWYNGTNWTVIGK